MQLWRRPSATTVEATRELLDQAVTVGLLNELGENLFGFVQAAMPAVLIESLQPTQRAACHRHIAAALETIGASGVPPFEELARHWLAAGEQSRAVGHLLQAAQRDMNALAFESARRRFTQVTELLAHDSETPVVVRAGAWLGLADACRSLGDPIFGQWVQRAARLAIAAHDVDIAAQAAALSIWPGSFFFIAEQPDEQLIALCESTLAIVPADHPLRARVLATLASHLTFDDDRDRRAAIIAEASQLATRRHDPSLDAIVLNAEYLCLWEPATLDRRAQIGREMGRLGRATGDADSTFLGAFFSAFCLAERGELGEARGRLEAVAELVAPTRNEYFAFLTERLALSIDIAQCLPGTAERIDGLLHRHANTYADTDGTWALQTGFVAYRAGTLGSMVGAMQAMTTGQQARSWLAALALARMCAGDDHGAVELLTEQGARPKNYFWMTVAQVQAEVACELHAIDHCQRLYDDLAPFAGRIAISGSGSLVSGLVSRSIGVLALALGRPEEAITRLGEALTQAQRCSMPFDLVISGRQLATAHARLGHIDEARRLANETRVMAQRYGFVREQRLLLAGSDEWGWGLS